MAIIIKSMNALGALKKLGLPQELMDGLQKYPIEVTLSATKFNFVVPGKDGDKKGYTVPVTLDQLQKLNAGTLQPAEKKALVTALALCIHTILKWVDAEGVQPVTAPELPNDELKAGILDKLPPLKPAESKEEPGWKVFDLSKLTTATPVKLRDATMLYQPVMGTSGGSRYFLVAANKDVRVAARIKGMALSVRIEGPNWQKYVSNMKSCGIDKIAKDYASIHLEAGSDYVMASKTLGSILMGLGIPFDTPIPDLKVIADKGA